MLILCKGFSAPVHLTFNHVYCYLLHLLGARPTSSISFHFIPTYRIDIHRHFMTYDILVINGDYIACKKHRNSVAPTSTILTIFNPSPKTSKFSSSQPPIFTQVIFFVSFTGHGKSTLIGHALDQLGYRGAPPATGSRGPVTRAVKGYAATVEGWTIGGGMGLGKSMEFILWLSHSINLNQLIKSDSS